ncbi:MAG: LPS-assembly protein LptD [Planctomycetes bacterium]|nr:LPS-assembly protein LptD [Planctomycetota bacterium]
MDRIKNRLFILVFFSIALLLPEAAFSALRDERGGTAGARLNHRNWVGEDLHLKGPEVITAALAAKSGGEHTLLFEGGFSMSIGANQLFSDKAVVWLKEMIKDKGLLISEKAVREDSIGGPNNHLSIIKNHSERIRIDYQARVYLQGNVSVKKGKGARATGLAEKVLEKGRSMVVGFDVSGEVFVTAEKRKTGDLHGSELYTKALAAVWGIEVKSSPLPSVPAERDVNLPVETKGAQRAAKEVVTVKLAPLQPEVAEKGGEPGKKAPSFRYPVNIRPAGEAALRLESTQTADAEDVMTIMGRFYLWQQDKEGGLLELQADNAVVWYAEGPSPREGEAEAGSAIGENVKAIYLAGDVVMTTGERTIRSEEIFYDFDQKKSLVINAVMRSFDVGRGIPIYARAAKLRQLAENKFALEEITLTSSEFYLPQISFNASSMIITDTTSVDERKGKVSDASYDAQMRDVRFKVGGRTIFYWPFIRSNLQRPDTALKSVGVINDDVWGTSVETRWHLSRLLGLRETEGTNSTFALDYYGKRGIGSGAEITYEREDYFGRLLGYIIRDGGEDRLGRNSTRRDLEPPRELRGRFHWQHRHFLPHSWQLTTEVSYASDENFIEGYYRSEFNVGKEQETLVHLKRIEDNWGLAFLGKARINDFQNKLEELPSAEFHWAGQSLFDDKLTLYLDSQVSRFRQRLASGSTLGLSEESFTFMSERAELDMPMRWGFAKVVPFVAGTFAYEDGSGFASDIDGGAAGREDSIWIGEVGARVFPVPIWKVYPDVESRLWDLKGLRHIIEPRITAVGYSESESVAEQRDILNVGITQRLQTKRGPADKQRTTDWMRLDMDVTWLNNSGDDSAGADEFVWNKPFIPLVNRFSGVVPLQDRRSGGIFGPRRNYIGADYIWRLSDTTAVLSDMNYDMQSGVVQQFNVGFSRLRWPNLSYYIGSRYLKRIDNGFGEEGSNSFTFAATYVLDSRYTVVVSQQYDFDYGANIRSDLTLIRRYHRLYYGITFRVDESLDRQSIIFSVWPEGIQELGIGPDRYMGQGGSIRY